ncbi:MAG: hypothetical protein ACT4P1_09775 [Sporichthyaceae bacterium]
MRPAPDITVVPAWQLEARRLSRLRLYSYCLTLLACVLGLLAFMYLAQGLADGDHSFAAVGGAFAAGAIAALWGAVLVTHVEGPRAPLVPAARPLTGLLTSESSATAA